MVSLGHNELICCCGNCCIVIQISLKFFPWWVKGPINKKSILVLIMAWHQTGDKPLWKKFWWIFMMSYSVTGPQWVNANILTFRNIESKHSCGSFTNGANRPLYSRRRRDWSYRRHWWCYCRGNQQSWPHTGYSLPGSSNDACWAQHCSQNG